MLVHLEINNTKPKKKKQINETEEASSNCVQVRCQCIFLCVCVRLIINVHCFDNFNISARKSRRKKKTEKQIQFHVVQCCVDRQLHLINLYFNVCLLIGAVDFDIITINRIWCSEFQNTYVKMLTKRYQRKKKN